jgi:hypothetical protein
MKLKKISFTPNDLQEMLLRACLEEEEIALQSWEQWKSIVDIDHLDSDSFNLIPLLYSNLSKFSISDPLMPTLKGIYRRSWYLNKILFHNTAELISQLSSNNIETILLKGAAWAHQYYNDVGSRQMEDVDLLIPYNKIREALSILISLGYHIGGNYYFEIPPEDYFLYNKELSLLNHKKHRLDLHWFAMNGVYNKKIDEEIWDRSVKFDFYGSDTRVVSSVDAILHTFVHGAFVSYSPPIRWVADSFMILKSLSGDENWDVFVTEVNKRHAGYPVSKMLIYLKERFGKNFPDELISKTNNLQFTSFEKFYFNLGRKGCVLSEESLATVFLVRLTDYIFFIKDKKISIFSVVNIFSLLDYFKSKNGLSTRFEVVKWMIARVSTRRPD